MFGDFPFLLIPVESVQWRKNNAEKALKKIHHPFMIKVLRERNREFTQLDKEYVQKCYK